MPFRWFAVLGGILPFFLTCLLHANVGDTYGYGSQMAATNGAGATWGDPAYSAFHNPALLANPSLSSAPSFVSAPQSIAPGSFLHSLELAWSFLAMHHAFLPIESVTVENGYTGDDLRNGNVNTEYKDVVGQALGFRLQTLPSLLHFSVGGVIYVPTQHFAHLDTGEPFVPEYVLYRSRTQRPQFDFGAAIRLFNLFNLGVGVHVGYGIAGTANSYLKTDDSKSSTMRFSATLEPKAVPFFGASLSPEGAIWNAGLVFRLPLEHPEVLTVNSGADAFDNNAALDYRFRAASTALYDPMSIEAGFSILHPFWTETSPRALVQLEYQFWQNYRSPFLQIKDRGSSAPVASSRPPSVLLKNILILKVAEEIPVGAFRIRAGYGYRPSIFHGPPNGSGNYLDPAKHMASAGLGWEWGILRIDLHASCHFLVRQKIEKTANDEAGDSSSQKIGAPGYDAGGKIYGGGVTVGIRL